MHVCSVALACSLLFPSPELRPQAELVLEPESVSCGSTNRGALSDSSRMPTEGVGYVMAEPWRSRGSRFGTRELVSLIQRSAALVAHNHPGSQLSIADISKERGGAIQSHRSHQSGRDVDLIYYAMDAKGDPFYPDSHMAYYTTDGVATSARAPKSVDHIPKRYFDLKRNWSLVRAMVFDSQTRVEYIFVSPRVKRWLLFYATDIGESEEVLRWANKVIHSRDVKGHSDHMHVRIACSDEDLASGQCDSGSARRPRNATRWNRILACPAPADAPVLPKRAETTRAKPEI